MRKLRVILSIFAVAIILTCSSQSSVIADDGPPTRANGTDEEARWAQFRGNLNNSGYSVSPIPETNAKFLNFSTMWPIYSSAVYSKGMIYFGSQSRYVYAVEAVTGEEVWSYETGAKIDSTPVVHEDTVYVGSSDSNLYAFNATTGDLLWSYPVGGEIVASPKYYNGSVFFGSKDWNFYALNVTDQSLTWGAPFPAGGEIWGSPAIADDRVFFGSNGGNLYSVWIENGTVDWNFTITAGTNGSVRFSSPTVYKGRVVVGSDDNNVYCLDEFTGEELWRFTAGGYVYSSAAIHNDTVFISSNDFNFYALPLYEDGDGVIALSEILWEVFTGDFEGGSSPAVAEGKVLIGSTAYGLMVFNETDGSHYWNFTIPGGAISSPSIVDGKIFIGGQNGVMYGLGASGRPSLEVELLPDADSLKANRVMGITFLVTHDQAPVEGAFVSLTISMGELSQQGASTFSDGTNRVKYTAPTVVENTTVTITAVANKFGFDEGRTVYQIVIEPGTSYENLTTESDFPIVKYSGYIVALVVLIMLNIVAVIFLIRIRKKEEEDVT
jgi:outer membrane protein assembly factor BamB